MYFTKIMDLNHKKDNNEKIIVYYSIKYVKTCYEKKKIDIRR